MSVEQESANILKLLKVTGAVAATFVITGLIFRIPLPQVLGVVVGAAYVMITIVFYTSLARKLLKQDEARGLLMTKLVAKTLIMAFGAYLIVAGLRGAELGIVVGIFSLIPAALWLGWNAK